MAVCLRPLLFSERHIVDTIALDADQQRFAGGSLDDIFRVLHASAHRNAVHAFCVVADEAVVGFFVLREGSARPVWALGNTITLHSLRISRSFQGRGFGMAAMRLTGRWIKAKRPAISHLMLTVNADNSGASVLYRRCGFRPTGILFRGRIGPECVMICPIDEMIGPLDAPGR